ncbi:MAG: uracil-xanthine permease [Oscillospiraceae bacterium]|nr:uracil-xanthine permease [Oscillospiraceae bacterium]
MKLIYGIQDKPKLPQRIVFAFQQLLAIMAATIAVPNIIGHDLSPAAALFGAGVGTLVYLLFTRFKSPVFLGSSFAFLGSMSAAFAGGVSMSLGYLGLILGAFFAGLVYVVIAMIVKLTGSAWINKLMPAVVIGPTVAIIGLSLAGNAVGDLFTGNVTHAVNAEISVNGVVQSVESLTINGESQALVSKVQNASPYLCLLCGLLTLFVTMICSVYGKKFLKMIPFIVGICAGYALAAILTVIGNSAELPALQIIDFTKFSNLQWYPDFTFLKAFSGGYEYGEVGGMGTYIATIAIAYIPVAFVVFAEHIADHKNISSIIEADLLADPGLHNTLLGDGVGSMVGALFGGCPNTTYGESIGCVAISGNASVVTILTTAILAIAISFLAPFSAFLSTIPSCVMGGVCMALYGFIAVSGLKMLQSVDLEENRNLFVASAILIAGIGGMTISFGPVVLTKIACALILGVMVNTVLSRKKA